MRNNERARQKLRAEMYRKKITIKMLAQMLPYSKSTCYQYLSGAQRMTRAFVEQVQRVLDMF